MKNIKQNGIIKLSLQLLGICLVVISFSGCKAVEKILEYNLPKVETENQTKEKTIDSIPPSNYKKQEISLSMSTFKSLNPYDLQDDSVNTVLKQCYQGLMTLSLSGDIVPQLADDVTLSEDSLSCDINLGNKQFHNGMKVGLNDIRYSLAKARAGKYAKQVAAIKKVVSIGENQIRIEFNGSGLLNLYSLCFPIVPNNSLEKGNPTEINGTGPYRMMEYKPKQSLILQSETNRLEINLSRQETDAKDAFLNGLTDVYYTEEFPWLSFSEETLKNISKFPSSAFYYIGFKLDNSLMADVNIRNYLSRKLDRTDLYKNVFLNHIIYQSVPFYKGLKWEQALDQKEINKGLDEVDVNPIAAGQKLRLIYPMEDKYMQIMANKIDKDWSPYVTVELVGLNHEEYLTALSTGDFDLYLTRIWIEQYPNLKDFLSTGGFQNYSNISTLDQLVYAFMTAANEEALRKAYLNLSNEINKNTWIVPIGFLENAVIVGDQVDGKLTSKTYDLLSGITEIIPK